MNVKDFMTTRLVTLRPGNSIGHAAQIMLDHGVSGLPVVDDNALLVGILSEGDLLRRTELGTDGFAAAGGLMATTEDRADAYVKSHSWMVAHVMTTSVVTVEEDTPINEVARLMADHSIKRVPVMRQGKLVGIVSRRDFLRVLIAARFEETANSDTAIRRSILVRLGEDTGLEVAQLSVAVANGVVDLSGTVGSEAEREAARVAAEGIRGVAVVTDRLRVVPK